MEGAVYGMKGGCVEVVYQGTRWKRGRGVLCDLRIAQVRVYEHDGICLVVTIRSEHNGCCETTGKVHW